MSEKIPDWIVRINKMGDVERFKEHGMTGIIYDTQTKKDVGCYEVRPLMNELAKENSALTHEVEVLRRYGNKDCTAMADDYLKNGDQE